MNFIVMIRLENDYIQKNCLFMFSQKITQGTASVYFQNVSLISPGEVSLSKRPGRALLY